MKKLVILLVVLVLLGGGFWFVRPFLLESSDVEEISVEELESLGASDFVPTFTQVPLDFEHTYVDGALPFLGSAVVRMDADGEMFEGFVLGGGRGQEDMFFMYHDGEFGALPLGGEEFATYGMAIVDMTGDGNDERIIVRENGIFIDYIKGVEQVDFELAGDAIPFSVAPGDINGDGYVDLYVSTWIQPSKFKAATFNDEAHKTANVMLLNKGEAPFYNTFMDVTDEVGLTFSQNTFLSSFVDLNNDGVLDLVVATNTDSVRIFANDGNGKFSEIDPPTVNGFWMGLAVGDIDNDGDEDLFFSNSGATVPVDIARGDLRGDQEFSPEWALLRNDGDFVFTDITEEAGLAGLEFGWGANFGDLNLNGRQDLVAVGNYIKWPAHKLNKGPGRVLMNSGDDTFLSVIEASGATNRQYGINPLVLDFNGDGYLDIVYANINGPSLAYMNNGAPEGEENHYLKVDMPDNARSLGARVMVETVDGKTLHQQFRSSTGLLSDPSPVLTFGLGQSSEVKKVTVEWPSGGTDTFKDVGVDSILRVE